ncbi:MAG: hypothetical protein U0736_09850 [Gemmataceae bacterium]
MLAVPVGRSQDELSVLVWDVATGEERFRLRAAPAYGGGRLPPRRQATGKHRV